MSRELADIQAAKAVNDEPIDLTELTGNIDSSLNDLSSTSTLRDS